jgi:hypothetical protein|tara:strand:- start:34 stop:351 length:318 start_codon:yes stop_codon:yes gene_type:complete
MKEVSIGFQVQYEHFIDFDEDCGLCVQFFAGEAHQDDPVELVIPFGDMFDEALLEGKQELDYQFLYNMAHEFNRYSELAREAAMLIEGSSSSLEDMYGLDSGDLD